MIHAHSSEYHSFLPFNRKAMAKIPPSEVRAAFDDVDYVDYKNLPLLRKITSYYGKIKPRRYTGLTARQQRKAAGAIKKARIMGLLFFVR